jgi:glycerol 3-phosphatase-2
VTALRDEHDVLLVDLDGTVYRGSHAVPGAVDALSASSPRRLFVTNNASRSPHEVAAALTQLGFTAGAADVVTSAQAAARVLAERLPAGARVLVVGARALAEEVRRVGLDAVSAAADDPVAVVQGHSPDTAWPLLAEAALAIAAGALWVATNVDPTLPSERGLLPGNGSMVAALRTATGAQPLVAGKPARPLLDDAVARSHSRFPLVVGDRLDTDIEGANVLGARSLLVLTGVSTPLDLLRAPTAQRPHLVAADLSALAAPASASRIGPVAGWSADVVDGSLVLSCTDSGADPVNGLRAACGAAWEHPGFTDVRAAGAGARAALRSWGLSSG